MIDTRQAQRRTLEFDTLDQALADARRCAEADQAGTLHRTGNWTAGQIFGHLAWWIEGSFDGFPMSPPWFVKLLGPLMRSRALRRPAQMGFRLPGAPDGTYGTEQLSTAEGLARLERAYARLNAAPPSRPNPVFGRMTHDQWKQLHLRHAEGHLSVLHPPG